MSKLLKYSFKQIFGNPATRIMVLVFLFIAGIVLSFMMLSYRSHVNSAINTEFAKLSAATRSLSMHIDAQSHNAVMKHHPHQDDIRDWQDDLEAQQISTLLSETHDALNMSSDIYTVVRDEQSGSFQFGVTSAERPYFRHTWAHPHEEHVKFFAVGAEIGPYEDENGVWLSAFSPIELDCQAIAIVQADREFSGFIQEARNDFKSYILLYVVIFLIATAVLVKIIERILCKQESDNLKFLEQARLIEEKNADILSSIRVAKRLQEACLPNLVTIREHIPEFEVMYQPRDLVSGDFYWHERVGNKVYLAAGDCTGHGVPGAFMSMMALTALYHVLNQCPSCLGELLTKLDTLIRAHLHSTSNSSDGLDMSICSYDIESGELKFAGALRPLVLVQNGKLTKVKGDRSGIGGHSRGFEFTEHSIDVSPGDMIYLYSDGFSDQFGGERGRKYMSKRFNSFLEQIQEHTIDEQKVLLQYEFNLWKQDIEQVDDVVVLAFRIPDTCPVLRLIA